ncbi:hypothetical protein PFISCL1PPCAC_25531, partial [Pristionchus fissidentatus]
PDGQIFTLGELVDLNGRILPFYFSRNAQNEKKEEEGRAGINNRADQETIVALRAELSSLTEKRRSAIDFPKAVIFWHVVEKERKEFGSASYWNELQMKYSVHLVKYLIQKYPGMSVMCVSVYDLHAKKLQRAINDMLTKENLTYEFSRESICTTIDAIQGADADFIIVNTVRCNLSRELGSSGSEDRVNVALSRAKRSLFILGDAHTLTSSESWRMVIKKITSMAKNGEAQIAVGAPRAGPDSELNLNV